MPFADLLGFFDPDLPLVVGPRTYVVPAPDEATVLRLHALRQVANGTPLSPEDQARITGDEWSLYPVVLGDAYRQMTEDKQPLVVVRHAALTAYVWAVSDGACYHGDAVHAQRYWSSLGKARSTPETTETRTDEDGGTPNHTPGSGTPVPPGVQAGPMSSATGP